MPVIDRITQVFLDFAWYNLIEILLYFVLLCFALIILKKNNAKSVIWYYCIFTGLFCVVLLAINNYTDFKGGIYIIISQLLFVLSVVVLFATEIKREIWTSRRGSDNRHADQRSSHDANACIEEIIKAVQNMSKNDIGAIIILSNGNLPNGVLESGVTLNADISAQLIESIFFPKTALHDGAMVLYDTKIQAAGCFLPLAQEVNLSKELGSRHRAGIGLTETANVTAIIVSEETGIISIAKGGKIVRYVDTNVLRETLKLFYWQDLID